MSKDMLWIYVFGERSGRDIKIGKTGENDLRARLRGINADQTTDERYEIIAGVRGTSNEEKILKNLFTMRSGKGNRTEYFEPTPDLVEYANWLRAQWFTTHDGAEPGDSMTVADPSFWLPEDHRRIAPPVLDPDKLIQDYDSLHSNLSGTAWSWMVNPQASIQDYFTPTELIDAARTAMGDIDLDAASHYLANKAHRVPDYFHVNRSAFENPWHGRVWLNPPYGDNAPWWREIERYIGTGEVEQLCMLSPMWTFGTRIARPVMELSSAFLVLTPTPKFWGNSNPERTGKNLPHAVMYIGDHPDRFLKAFQEFGMPLTFRWDLLDDDYAPPREDIAV